MECGAWCETQHVSVAVGRYGQDAVGLHGNAGQALAHHGDLGDRVGAGERVGIALGWEVGAEADVGAMVGEQQRGVGRQCIDRTQHGRQRLVVDHDTLGGVGGLGAGLGHDGGDDVADEAHLARGEDGPVQRLRHHRELLQRREAQVVAAGVVDGHHAGHGRRLADIDGDQVAVGDVDRAKATCSIPGSTRSSTYLPSPVKSVGSSRRRTAFPRIEPAVAMIRPPSRTSAV